MTAVIPVFDPRNSFASAQDSEWLVIEDCSGCFTNKSVLTWMGVDTKVDGVLMNLSGYVVMDDMDGGLFNRSGFVIDDDTGGGFVNQSGFVIDDDVDGVLRNRSGFLINNSCNGLFFNVSGFVVEDGFNGFFNGFVLSPFELMDEKKDGKGLWGEVDNVSNSMFMNFTSWMVVDNKLGGVFVNVSGSVRGAPLGEGPSLDIIERGSTWNRIDNGDGTYTLSSYISPVNYLNETSEEYEPINTTVVEKSLSISGRDYSYGVDRGIYEAYFRSQSSDVKDRPVAMVKDNYVFTLSPVDYVLFEPHKHTADGRVGNRVQSDATASNNSVSYNNQYKEIGSSDGFANLTYAYLSTGIKSEYVIWDKDYLLDRFDSQCNAEDYDTVNVTFDNIVRCYDTSDIDSQTLGIVYGSQHTSFKEYGLSGNGEFTTDEYIEFRDSSNETVFFIPYLYAYDNGGNSILLNKTVSMTDFGNLRVSILVPYSWLNETAVFPVVVDPSVDIDVGSSSDDAYEYYGSVNIDGDSLPLTSSFHIAGFRFNIDVGDVDVVSAYLKIYLYSSVDDDAYCNIYAEDIADSSTFTTSNNDISDRTKTTNYVSWSEGNLGTGWQTSPDISTVFDELLDSYSALNSVSLIWEQTMSNWDIRIRTWDYSSHQYAPQLNLTYSTTTGCTNPTAEGDDYNQWFNAEKAFTSNNDYAAPDPTDVNDFYNFHFNDTIGEGDTVDGIEVTCEGYTEREEGNIYFALSWDGGSSWTTESHPCSLGTGSDDTDSTGGYGDDWGKSGGWSASEINDANFRVRATAPEIEDTIRVDHICCNIYYTSGGGGGGPETSIDYAGNFGDWGGPYWNDSACTTTAEHGYYTNSSCQSENFINITVSTDTTCAGVKVHLWDVTADSWDNSSYTMTRPGEPYFYYCNITGLTSGHKYSFDINATDGSNHNITAWEKIAVPGAGATTRRYVSLNCTVDNSEFVFTPFYFQNLTYASYEGSSSQRAADNLIHDQGRAAGHSRDVIIMNSSLPPDEMQKSLCSGYTVAWFDENVTIDYTEIDNVYYHIWWSGDDNATDLGYNTDRGEASNTQLEYFSVSDSTNESYIYLPSSWMHEGTEYWSNHTFLEAHLFELSEDVNLTDNSVYEFCVVQKGSKPIWRFNRSVMSYVIFNVPDNTTLKTWNNDSDDLNSWEELYITYTNPFVTDTDNDGVDDGDENLSGSDPNDYTDTEEPSVDTDPPEMIIMFAGNPGDDGGPERQPPNETGTMADDGYYTNNSRQQESFINISCLITDAEGIVSDVDLHLWDVTGSSWDNSTYSFAQVGSTDTWYCNATGLTSNHKYSFDVEAADDSSNVNTTWWNKTGLGSGLTRRYVTLGCTPVNISYQPLYFSNITYTQGVDTSKPDRLLHDQGPDATAYDSDFLNFNSSPNHDSLNLTWCSNFVGFYFAGDVCVEDINISNIHYHIWHNESDPNDYGDENSYLGWDRTRGFLTGGPPKDYVDMDDLEYKTKINVTDNLGGNFGIYGDYELYSFTKDLAEGDRDFTDNSIYEFFISSACDLGAGHGQYPSVLSNQSMMSYVLLNVPANTTLEGLDNDGDGLSDYEEIWITFTNPFIDDTDNDGVTDYNENLSGSDPNNYTDTEEVSILTSVDTITPYDISTTPLTVTASTDSGSPDNVTLYYRYSDDNETWGGGGSGTITVISNTSAIEDPSNDVEITKPDDVQDNDVLFVYLFHDNNDAEDEFNTLSGWTQIFNLTDDPSGRGGTTWCGYHIVTDSGSEPASYTFVHTDATTEDTGGIMVNLRGVDTSDVLANDTGYTYLFQANTGDFLSPDITTDEDNAMVLCMGSMSHAMTSCVQPTGTSLIKFVDWDYCNLMIANYTKESAGATGDKQWDTDGVQEARGLQVAFKPSAGGGGGAGCDWTLYTNDTNPDEDSPWSWSFNFPGDGSGENVSGYYEFYSIGKADGYDDETVPGSADAICNYTHMVATWSVVDESFNGIFSNSTVWMILDESYNGIFSNSTAWYVVDESFNGIFSNSTDWTVVNDTINGTFSNSNNPPTQSNPSPSNGSSDVNVNPVLSIDVEDLDGNDLDVYWYSNSSVVHYNWYTHGYNSSRWSTGEYNTYAPINNTVIWSVDCLDDYDEFGGPIIIDGVVYHPTKHPDGKFYARYLNNGTEIWNYTTGKVDDSATYYDGKIYIQTDYDDSSDEKLICLWASNGTLVWEYEEYAASTRYTGCPAIDPENNLVITPCGSKVYALWMNNGTMKWNFTTDDYSYNGIPADVTYYNHSTLGGIIAFGASHSGVYCLYSSNGTEIWQNSDSSYDVWDVNPIFATVDGTEVLIYGSGSNREYIYCLYPTNGTVIWDYWGLIGSYEILGMAYHDGKIFAGGGGHCLYCLNATLDDISDEARELWLYSPPSGAIYSAPVVTNGFVYFTSASDDKFWCLWESNGTKKWDYTFDEACYGNIAMADGILVVGCDDGYLRAFGDLNQYNTTTGWELFASNLTVGNGTYYQTNSNFSEHDTTYWWRVCVTDGRNWSNETYHFTTNQLPWKIVDDTISGVFTNATGWSVVDESYSGIFGNSTSWTILDDTVSGVFSNITDWTVLDDSFNGLFSNATGWSVVDESYNGIFSNSTSWTILDDTINGVFSNSTDWIVIDDTYSGVFSNSTSWTILDDTINGVFSNSTSWTVVDESYSGVFSNSTDWTILDDAVNGVFSNSTSWVVINNSYNGIFTNISIEPKTVDIQLKTTDDVITAGDYINLTDSEITTNEFGWGLYSSTWPQDNAIHVISKAFPNEDLYFNNISVYLTGWGAGEKVKCALYWSKTWSYKLLAETEELTGPQDDGWVTFNFSEPVFVDKDYDSLGLAYWSDSSVIMRYESGGSDRWHYQDINYNGNYPDLFLGEYEAEYYGYRFSIKAGYTELRDTISKIETDDGNFSAYLHMQIEKQNGESWELVDDTVNETVSRDFNYSETLNLSEIFNGIADTSNLSGYGTYRVNVSLQRATYDIFRNEDDSLMQKSYVFYYRSEDSQPSISLSLTGNENEGNYTNGTWQKEDYMLIQAEVTDNSLDKVYLQWLNDTTWTNDTYEMSNTGGDTYEYNMTGLSPGYNYSFDIWANDTNGNNNTVVWHYINNTNEEERKYVQLGHSVNNSALNYSILYFHTYPDPVYGVGSYDNCLKHEQGTDAPGIEEWTKVDFGVLSTDPPVEGTAKQSPREYVTCANWIGFFLDKTVCVDDWTPDNIYTHIWAFTASDAESIQIGYDDNGLNNDGTDEYYVFEYSDSVGPQWPGEDPFNLTFWHQYHGLDSGGVGTGWYTSSLFLDARKWVPSSPPSFSDNNVYDFHIDLESVTSSDYPSLFSNSTMTSFVLFNVPDNATLNASYADSDSDSLSDWNELYVTYTNPFDMDTDNDGISDYTESLSGSDPNDYMDAEGYTASWKIVDESYNGIFSNSTDWVVVDSSFNGVFSNSTSWMVVDDTFSGIFTNSTLWSVIDDTYNGVFSNSTSWMVIDESYSGVFSNATGWMVVDDTINGVFTSSTDWNVVDESCNGIFSNSTDWEVVDESCSGIFSNSTVWMILDESYNGIFSNSTSWLVIDDTISGVFTGTGWAVVDESYNGIFTNSTLWSVIDDAYDGIFSNSTSWSVLDESYNGVFSNSTGWKVINNTYSGVFSNSTDWMILDDAVNGIFSNSTSWMVVDSSFNGVFTNSTAWFVINESYSGVFTNVTGWSVVGDSFNGIFSNSTDWTILDESYNGVFTNSTDWVTVNDSYSGIFSNSTSWLVIDDAVDGVFSNSTSWMVIDDTFSGIFTNSTLWSVIDDTYNGVFSNSTSWMVIDESYSGVFSNATGWSVVDESYSGIFSNSTSWLVIDDAVDGVFSNSTSWTVVDESYNGIFSNNTVWTVINNSYNGSFSNVSCSHTLDLSSDPVEFATILESEYNVNATGQNSGTCAINITNDADIPVDISIKLNESIGSNIHLKYNTTFNPPGYTPSSISCYQEHANVSTSCGGLDTGNYSGTGDFATDDGWRDGNWSTYTPCSVGQSIDAWINYTIPDGALDTSKIRMKGSVVGDDTYSIEDAFYNGETLWFKVHESNVVMHVYSFHYYNGTDWVMLANELGYLYEEAMYWDIPKDYESSNEVNTTPVTVATSLPADTSMCLYLWADFDNPESMITVDRLLNVTVAPSSGYSGATNYSDVDLRFEYSGTKWRITEDSYNGVFSNSTDWVVVDNSFNGVFTNNTDWMVVDDTVNGVFTSSTDWTVVDESCNGIFSNSTDWEVVDESYNGIFTNSTLWSVIDDTYDGVFTSSTDWTVLDDSFNGLFSNSTGWKVINNIYSGVFTNATTWYVINDTYSGVFSNSTEWVVLDDTINGIFSNSTTWFVVDGSYSGVFSNGTTWVVLDDTINGVFTSSTDWTVIDESYNGVFTNTTTWYVVDESYNGIFSNNTVWTVINNSYNGSFSNVSCSHTLDLSSDPVEFATILESEYNVNATGQNSGTCAINITNDADIPVDISIKLNESIGSNIHLKYNTTFNPPGYTLGGGGDGSYSGWEEEIANSSGRNRLKIVYDSSNRPHIAGQNGFYAYRADNGTWRGQENTTHPDIIKISDTPDGAYGIDIDSSGIPHIVYHSGEEVLYAVWNSTASSWDKEIVDNHVAYGSYGTRQFYLDSNDKPHILYHVKIDGTYYVNYTYKDSNGVWRGQENTTHPDTIPSIGLYPNYPSMALDSNDYPHIAYADIHSPHQDVFYRYWNGGSWVLVNLSDELNIPVHSGTDTNIVIYNDLPSILIHADYAFPAPDKTEFLYYNGSSWNKEQLINSDCDHPTHVYNSTGVIFAVGGADGADFDDNDDRLIVFKKEDGIWTNETLKLANQYVHSEIAVASNGTIGFIYEFNGSSTNYYHNYTSSTISYSCDDEITTDSSTVKTSLAGSDSFCLYLWADFDNPESMITVDRLLNVTVAPSSGYSGATNYSDVDLRFEYSGTKWRITEDSYNGVFSNSTDWVVVDNSFNGVFTNNTDWMVVDDTVNGVFTSSTDWTVLDDSFNGVFSNSTGWKVINNTYNGVFSNNTSWSVVDESFNGVFSNATGWSVVNDTYNGVFSNSTDWVILDESYNGIFSNSTAWSVVDESFNGVFSNSTSWTILDDTVSGIFSDSTSWTVLDDTISGVFSNSTSWSVVDKSYSGMFSNSTEWVVVDESYNGIFSNSTVWTVINNSYNGSFSNVSCSHTLDLSSDPVEFATILESEYDVNAAGQSSGICAVNITNDAEVPVDISIKLNESIGSNIHLKYNTTFNPPGYTPSSISCYQEHANVSTSCGGLDTGNYSGTGDFATDDGWRDGNWSTGTGNNDLDWMYAWVNYTIPDGALNTSVWHACENAENPFNLSIADAFYGDDTLWFQMKTSAFNMQTVYYYYNGTDWVQVRSDDGCLLEEAMYWDIPKDYESSNEVNTTPVTVATSLPADTSMCLYLWADFDNPESMITVDRLLNITVAPSSGYSGATNCSDVDLRFEYSGTKWRITDDSYNGVFSNSTDWIVVDDTVNGVFTSSTDWTILDEFYNGVFSNSTGWKIVNDTVSGIFTNSTLWSVIDESFNGVFSNSTGWEVVDESYNGMFSNNTEWVVVDESYNGVFSNSTDWEVVDESYNGIFSNSTDWVVIDDTYSGIFSNATQWLVIDDTISGVFTGTGWKIVNESYNGIFSNSTAWSVVDESYSGVFSNSTDWVILDDTYSGIFSNSTDWTILDDTFSGVFSNSTEWVVVDSSFNGVFSNSTDWMVVDDTVNGVFTSSTDWTILDEFYNGVFSNSTGWTVIDDLFNGVFSNTTGWSVVNDTYNGIFTNATTWIVIDDNINGVFSNSTDWMVVDVSYNGVFSNSTSWSVINNTFNGEFSNCSWVWSSIDNTMNGVFSNSTSWVILNESYNGMFTNTTTWIAVDDNINGAFSNSTNWRVLDESYSGMFSNGTTWVVLDDTVNGVFSNTTGWTVISDDFNGVFTSSTDWTVVDESYNGIFSNSTFWSVVSESYSGVFSNATVWSVINNTYDGSFYNILLTLPNVTTNASTGVEETNATLHGYLVDDGGSCTVGFEYGTTTSYGLSINGTDSRWDNYTSTSSTEWLYEGQEFAEKYIGFSGQPVSVDWNIGTMTGSPSGDTWSEIRYVSNNTLICQSEVKDASVVKVAGWDTFNFTSAPYINNENVYVIIRTDTTSGNALGIEKGNDNNRASYYGDMPGQYIAYSKDIDICFNYLLNTTTEGHTFSSKISNFSPGTLYHYRAFASNSNGTGYGDDMVVLTKPTSPSNLSSVSSSNTIYLTWDEGTGANYTYIERNTSETWSRGEGSLVYNGTGIYCYDVGLLEDTTYYYQAWSYTEWNPYQYSDNYASASNTTQSNLFVITNMSTGVEETNATLHGYLSDAGEVEKTQLLQDGTYTMHSATYTRVGQKLTLSDKTVEYLEFYLYKYGSPDGNFEYTIRYASNDTILASKDMGLANNLDVSSSWVRGTFDTPVYVDEEVYILVEYDDGDGGDYIRFHRKGNNEVSDENLIRYDSGYYNVTSAEAAYIIGYSPNCTVGFQWGETDSYGTTIPFTKPVYIGGSVTNKVYRFYKKDLDSVTHFPSSGTAGTVYSIIEDDEYVYVTVTAAQKVYQYWASNLTKKDETDPYGDVIFEIEQDDTYIYFGGNTIGQIWQCWKSNLTKKAQTTYISGDVYRIAVDDTYVYALRYGTDGRIYQFWKSNLTEKQHTTVSFGGIARDILESGDYIYLCGPLDDKIKRYWKTNLTKKDESSVFPQGEPRRMVDDDTYIYVGTSNGYLYRVAKTDLSFGSGSNVYDGNVIRSMAIDDTYLYIGGDVIGKVYQLWPSNKTKRAESYGDYGGGIYAISTNSSWYDYFNSPLEFSYNLTGLDNGTLYHYRAFANDSGGTAYGNDMVFLTKPTEPTGFTVSAYNTTQINLTWNKGTGANYTYIERNTSETWSRGEGAFVYNNTGTSCNDIGLDEGTTYYYQAWSYSTWTYNPTVCQWSDSYASGNSTTLDLPEVTTNASTGVGEYNATVHGYLADDAGENCTVGFEYGTTTDYGEERYVFPSITKYGSTAISSTDIKAVEIDGKDYMFVIVSGNNISIYEIVDPVTLDLDFITSYNAPSGDTYYDDIAIKNESVFFTVEADDDDNYANVSAMRFNGETISIIDTIEADDISFWDWHTETWDIPETVACNDTYVFVATAKGYLYVYSFDGSSFTYVDNSSMSEWSSGSPDQMQLEIDDGYIYIANIDGICIFSFDGSTLTEEAHYNSDDGGGGSGISIIDGYVLFSEYKGVRLFTWDGSTLSEVDFYSLPGTSVTYSATWENLTGVGKYNQGVFLFSVADDTLYMEKSYLEETLCPPRPLFYKGVFYTTCPLEIYGIGFGSDTEFDCNLKNLTYGTYHYRSFAINGNGIAYGEDMNFTTVLWILVDDTINGVFGNSTSWSVINDMFSGMFTNTSMWWRDINTSYSGVFSNSTSWYVINSTYSGVFSNSTDWVVIDDTYNGVFGNSTSWKVINNTYSGVFTSSTDWTVINESYNGIFSNSTVWMILDESYNGIFSNSTDWVVIDDTYNGVFSNSTVWKIVNNSFSGVFTNSTLWSVVDDTVNGVFGNSTSWYVVNDTYSGIFSNTTVWQIINESYSGIFTNSTVWSVVNDTYSGIFSNSTSWYVVNDTYSGIFSNTTVWQIFNDSFNGTFVNVTTHLWYYNITASPSTAVQGSYVNITVDVISEYNVSFIHINFTGTYQTMSQHNDTCWYYNDSYLFTGTYEYYIYGKDEFNHTQESAETYTFRIFTSVTGGGGVDIIKTIVPTVELAVNESSIFVVQVNNVTDGEPVSGVADYIYCYIYYPNDTIMLNGSHPYEYLPGIYIHNFTADVIGDYVCYAVFDCGYTYMDANMFSVRWNKYTNYTELEERINRLSVSGQLDRQNQTQIITKHLTDQDKKLGEMEQDIDEADTKRGLQDVALESLFQTIFMIIIFVIIIIISLFLFGQRRARKLVKKLQPQQIAQEIVFDEDDERVIKRRRNKRRKRY